MHNGTLFLMYLCISIGHIYICYILRKSVSLHLTMIGCFVRYAMLNARSHVRQLLDVVKVH